MGGYTWWRMATDSTIGYVAELSTPQLHKYPRDSLYAKFLIELVTCLIGLSVLAIR